MGLFVCHKCSNVENTSCCDNGLPVSDKYPGLHLMEMHGQGYEDVYIDGKLLKKKEDILMLCSECNT